MCPQDRSLAGTHRGMRACLAARKCSRPDAFWLNHCCSGPSAMRIIMWILGVAAVITGVVLPILGLTAKTDIALSLCVGAALVAAGISYFVAAARSYRGHWAFVVGVALIVLGFLGLGSEIDDALAGHSKDLLLGITLILLFSLSGALLLWSAQKLHRCSIELERAKNGSLRSAEGSAGLLHALQIGHARP